MTLPLAPGAPLAETAPSRLFADWIRGGTELDSAASELAAVGGGAGASALWFRDPGCEGWTARTLGELAGDEDRQRFLRNVTALAEGRARTVVTGQQPGFGGGPLLTLHKIATTIALARRETAAGRPTVPVFWSGDDDDDLVEALSPVAWDPAGGGLVGSEESEAARSGRRPRQRLGTMAADTGQRAVGRWLDEHATGTGGDLAQAWRATADGTWADRARRLLLRVFAGTGLMVVSGDDPALHGAAEPLYKEILERREELAHLARRRGGELVAGGWHAQINGRSVERHLFRAEGQVRRPVAKGDVAPAREIRPGVLLRSLVQDALLAPKAVVVGPSELAYLRQLDPLHDALGIPRSPLVPRLFAWVVPPGMDPEVVATHGGSSDEGTTAWVDAWLERTTADLAATWQSCSDVAVDRAAKLAADRTRRWRRGLVAAVRNQDRRNVEAGAVTKPDWVFPGGARQERGLAWVPLLARGGPALRDAILDAAEQHLAAGEAGDWREWLITWNEGEDPHGR